MGGGGGGAVIIFSYLPGDEGLLICCEVNILGSVWTCRPCTLPRLDCCTAGYGIAVAGGRGRGE